MRADLRCAGSPERTPTAKELRPASSAGALPRMEAQAVEPQSYACR